MEFPWVWEISWAAKQRMTTQKKRERENYGKYYQHNQKKINILTGRLRTTLRERLRRWLSFTLTREWRRRTPPLLSPQCLNTLISQTFFILSQIYLFLWWYADIFVDTMMVEELGLMPVDADDSPIKNGTFKRDIFEFLTLECRIGNIRGFPYFWMRSFDFIHCSYCWRQSTQPRSCVWFPSSLLTSN